MSSLLCWGWFTGGVAYSEGLQDGEWEVEIKILEDKLRSAMCALGRGEARQEIVRTSTPNPQ